MLKVRWGEAGQGICKGLTVWDDKKRAWYMAIRHGIQRTGKILRKLPGAKIKLYTCIDIKIKFVAHVGKVFFE